MARPRKLAEGELETMSEPAVKHMIRHIATQGGDSGAYPVYQVDEEVGAWVEKGYTLVTAFPYATAPDFVSVLYVLVKQA